MKKQNIEYFSEEVKKVLEDHKIRHKSKVKLTSWEVSLLELAANGLCNNEISKITYISSHTVKSHMAAIYRKLKAGNRTHAVYIAMKLKILN